MSLTEPSAAVAVAVELTVVIPSWNGADLLVPCLQSLQRSVDGLDYEVVVFDNGSCDDSVAVAESFSDRLRVRVMRSEANLGFAGACNQAVAATTAPFILLLNNDAVCIGDLRAGVEYLRAHQSVAVCQGPLLMADGRHIDSVGSLLGNNGFLRHLAIGEELKQLPPSRSVFSVKGAAMWLRREALDGAGLFDDDAFAYFEESDLCWRLLIRGWDVRYVRELPLVVHEIGRTATRLPASVRQFHSFKNRLRAILRYSEARTLPSILSRHLVACVGAAGALAWGRQWAQAFAVVRALGWNAVHARKTFSSRRQSQRVRRVSDRQLRARVGTCLSMWDVRRQQLAGDRAEAAMRAGLKTQCS